MINGLKSWWTYIADEGGDVAPDEPPAPVSAERLGNLSGQLPPAQTLSPLERSWLDADLTVPHSMLTLMKYQRAAAIQGPSAESHHRRRERLARVMTEAKELGFELPAEFISLLNDDHSVNRLRFGCHWFELPNFICRCPLDEHFAMVLFLCEAQGCNYTHLLLSPDGRHCVTRTMHWYGLHPEPPSIDSTDEEKQIFHYADSFAEFICQASDEIRRDERAGAEWRMRLADEARDAGELDAAVEMYQLALSYDPNSQEIAERIVNCERVRRKVPNAGREAISPLEDVTPHDSDRSEHRPPPRLP